MEGTEYDERERRACEERERRIVQEFLSSQGFTDVNFRRRRMLKSSYPLHEAVYQKNGQMVELLLAAKADPALKNSAKLTPLQLAQRNNREDENFMFTHAAVLQALKSSPAALAATGIEYDSRCY